MSEYRELLAGCGNQREKIIHTGDPAWKNLTTLDIDPNAGADIEHDLNRIPLPFDDETFDELHFYHVLEHIGQQGDWRFFFAQFSDFWRILKPNGIICMAVPSKLSDWMWGDPGHTRFLNGATMTFLDQTSYGQVGKTALTDYRHVYEADFEKIYEHEDFEQKQVFMVLRAVKPSRIVR